MITFKRETYAQCVEDIKPLLEDHWSEVEWGQEDIPLVPVYEAYEESEKHGLVEFYTMRDEDFELKGYAVYWIHMHPHHGTTPFANNDMLYVVPEHRHTDTVDFLKWIEAQLKTDVVTYNMKYKIPHITLMSDLGMIPTETVYSKYIG
jgi:hypothetical protein